MHAWLPIDGAWDFLALGQALMAYGVSIEQRDFLLRPVEGPREYLAIAIVGAIIGLMVYGFSARNR